MTSGQEMNQVLFLQPWSPHGPQDKTRQIISDISKPGVVWRLKEHLVFNYLPIYMSPNGNISWTWQ